MQSTKSRRNFLKLSALMPILPAFATAGIAADTAPSLRYHALYEPNVDFSADFASHFSSRHAIGRDIGELYGTLLPKLGANDALIGVTTQGTYTILQMMLRDAGFVPYESARYGANSALIEASPNNQKLLACASDAHTMGLCATKAALERSCAKREISCQIPQAQGLVSFLFAKRNLHDTTK